MKIRDLDAVRTWFGFIRSIFEYCFVVKTIPVSIYLNRRRKLLDWNFQRLLGTEQLLTITKTWLDIFKANSEFSDKMHNSKINQEITSKQNNWTNQCRRQINYSSFTRCPNVYSHYFSVSGRTGFIYPTFLLTSVLTRFLFHRPPQTGTKWLACLMFSFHYQAAFIFPPPALNMTQFPPTKTVCLK